MNAILEERSSGILLHPTSLPGPHGIGDIGPTAHWFAEQLQQLGQRWWQMLPVNPPEKSNSPYYASSAFAGNPLLISLERLAEEGWSQWHDLGPLEGAPADSVDFDRAIAFKMQRLEWAFARWDHHAGEAERAALAAFRAREASWLDDACLYFALHEREGTSWPEWPRPLRDRHAAALATARVELADRLRYHAWLQFVFDRQWASLKAHCESLGLRLMGDVPIFVARESADVWAHPEIFLLDANHDPKVVAGVPPDYFSADGQLWGNPLYDWAACRASGYRWWIERVRVLLTRFHAARLDHFIGFHNYWEVPATAKSAKEGMWRPGPGRALFDALRAALGEVPLIAEDLGTITAGVTALREACGFPGMRVVQFAFDPGVPENIHLPHRYPTRAVVYTGTHDNDTAVGWFQALSNHEERSRALDYLGADPRDIHWALIRAAWGSIASVAVAPLQDVLGLDGGHRMNRPGIGEGNWGWRWSGHIADETRWRLWRYTKLFER